MTHRHKTVHTGKCLFFPGLNVSIESLNASFVVFDLVESVKERM